MLYFRMFLTMAISLYTSRVVLNTLGVEDFGIYNVVAGVVGMFSFLNSAMSGATQRFLSFEIGKDNFAQLRKVFATSVNIHLLIALVILVLAETIGLWFLNHKLTIPEDRMVAANWIYQFAIFSFVVKIVSVPYTASIIAREHMNIYAYVSIVEVSLKLLLVFLIQWLTYDKLIMYGMLMFGVSFLLLMIDRIYAKRKFEECTYKYVWDKAIFKEMLGYTGWNLFGTGAYVTYNQGVNILLNIFFGPAINAARGIAYQVNGAINGFVGNFQVALNPQIVKSYAAGDTKYMEQLIFQGSKYAFFLLFCVSLPIIMETELILKWWLKIVPDYAVLFCRLVLINALIDSISFPIMAGAQASGRIKWYMIVAGGLLLLILPISYVFLKMGYPPQTTFYVSIVISVMAMFARLIMVSRLIHISVSKFLSHVVFRIVVVVIVSLILPAIVFYKMEAGLTRFFVLETVTVVSIVASILLVGLKKNEKQFLKDHHDKLRVKIFENGSRN